VSVTVGFSQATTSLIVPALGTTKPDSTAVDGIAEAGGETNPFAALLAMLTPGAQPSADAETATADTPAVAATGSTILPAALPVVDAPVAAPVLPELSNLQQSQQGKALLKDFTDALKAAKSAMDDGKPLDPALEKKLADTVDAIAAWFAGQSQFQPTPTDTSLISQLAAAGNILPAAPAGSLPPAPTPVDADAPPVDAADSAPVTTSPVAPATQYMQAKIVPQQLADLGDALKNFAAQLEKTSPELATALARLADRINFGDISDDAMAQLGLTRSLGSTSPELDQLVAAMAAKPEARSVAAPASPIAAPVLDVPESLAAQSDVSPTAPETKKAEVAQPEAPKSEAKADAPPKADAPTRPDPLTRSTDVKLDADVQIEPKVSKSDDRSGTADSNRAGLAPQANSKPDTPAAAAAPVVTNADAAAQVAQAAAATAATATRAIHAAYAAPVQQLNVPQVAFEVVRQFEAGNTRFQIRLDPADLGRIDVKLDLDKSGTVSAHMVVERPETLDLMMRDQRALQQALQQAGLDTSKTSLEFSLRQNPFAGTGADTGQGGNGGQPGFGPYGTPVTDESTELAAQTLYRGSASASGVNLFV